LTNVLVTPFEDSDLSALTAAPSGGQPGKHASGVLFVGSGFVAPWAATSHTHAFASITSKPTTLAGYGIVDAQAALGYTPVNKAGDTMTGALTVNNNTQSVNLLQITNSSGTMFGVRGRGGTEPVMTLANVDFLQAVSGNWSVMSRPMEFVQGFKIQNEWSFVLTGSGGTGTIYLNSRDTGNIGPIVIGASSTTLPVGGTIANKVIELAVPVVARSNLSFSGANPTITYPSFGSVNTSDIALIDGGTNRYYLTLRTSGRDLRWQGNGALVVDNLLSLSSASITQSGGRGRVDFNQGSTGDAVTISKGTIGGFSGALYVDGNATFSGLIKSRITGTNANAIELWDLSSGIGNGTGIEWWANEAVPQRIAKIQTVSTGFALGDLIVGANGVVKFRNPNNSADCAITAGSGTFSGAIYLGEFTVASLPPAAANNGASAQVTNSTLDMIPANYGATVVGGGLNRVRVFCRNSTWIIS
jgi:hypothetical protein